MHAGTLVPCLPPLLMLMPKALSKLCKVCLFISYPRSDCYFSPNFSAMMVLLNSGLISKRSQISGVDMVGRGGIVT